MGAKSHSTRYGQSPPRGENLKRQHIAAEAARIMAEEGISDFHLAKRKAAARLNLPATKHLPTNQEVETALQEYLHLFHSDRLDTGLRYLRTRAVEAMRFLAKFKPLLVGPVLRGTVTPGSEIQLHVSADAPEEVAFLLQEHHIPFEQAERRLRFGGERYETLPAYRFVAGNVTIELCIFNLRSVRETPLSPVDGKPMKRANVKEVENLLNPFSVSG